MKWNFNTKRFLWTVLAYAVLILSLDVLLTHFFDIKEPKQSIIEVFGALIIFQIIEEIIRRFKKK